MRREYLIAFIYWTLYAIQLLETAPLDIVEFMKNYGYLNYEIFENDPVDKPNNTFREAIELMQKFGQLPVTGFVTENTIELTRAPRCGVKDVQRKEDGLSSYILMGKGWNKRYISYFLVNGTASLSREILIQNIEKAFKLWEGVSPLRFFAAKSKKTADIVITFFQKKHGPPGHKKFDGPGRVVAHAWPPSPGNIISSEIHFDADETWVDRSNIDGEKEGIDFYSIAVHEIGHTMGLFHSDKYDSVMKPYYIGYEKNLRLGYDDILAMYKLYIESGKFDDDVGFPLPDPKDKQGKEIDSTDPIDNPEDCRGSFDAILYNGRNIEFFKGRVFWQIGDEFGTKRGPWPFRRYWKVTQTVEKIDAAYQRDTDGKFVLFTDKRYWIYHGETLDKNSPQPLTSLGFHKNVDSIDAAMVWKNDGKTYFFTGREYWCYNEINSRMEKGYPRPMLEWKYAPVNIDAAISSRNGSAYFFKGDYYWEINKNKELVKPTKPKLAKDWLGCN